MYVNFFIYKHVDPLINVLTLTALVFR